MLLLLPATLFAQSTAVLKKQATIVSDALVSGDYSTVVNYMYPKIVQNAGGKQKMLQLLTGAMMQMKATGATFQSATIGEPGKFYKAGREIHCLVPENIRVKTANGSFATQSNLLAVSQNGGKSWTFTDLNKATIDKIPQLFPYFNKDLRLPQPKTPSL